MTAALAVSQKCQHCRYRKASRNYDLCHACYEHKPTRSQYVVQEPCPECGTGTPNGGRRLCYPCHCDPAIRAKHLGTSRFAQRGHGQTKPTREPQPTQALPGTPEKIEVLEQRAKAGEYLWHPQDAVACGR